MANQDPKEIFRKKMENENTPYLQRILEIHNADEWSEEKFGIIADILRLRRGSISDPPQSGPETEQPIHHTPQKQKAVDLFAIRRIVAATIILVVLVPTIVVLFSFQNADNARSRCQARTTNGRTVSATITGLKRVFFGPSDSPSMDLRAEYSFPAIVNGQQKIINASNSISYELFSSLQVGQMIAVIYEVSNPDNSAVESLSGCSSTSSPVIILVALVVVSALLTYRLRQFLWPQKKKA